MTPLDVTLLPCRNRRYGHNRRLDRLLAFMDAYGMVELFEERGQFVCAWFVEVHGMVGFWGRGDSPLEAAQRCVLDVISFGGIGFIPPSLRLLATVKLQTNFAKNS